MNTPDTQKPVMSLEQLQRKAEVWMRGSQLLSQAVAIPHDLSCDGLKQGVRLLHAALHHLEAGKIQGIKCDGRDFKSPLDAALHLLWLLQRLSFYESHREGQPADGPRFREGIIEARKLLDTLDYEKKTFGESASS
jgi:hypothetical protein